LWTFREEKRSGEMLRRSRMSSVTSDKLCLMTLFSVHVKGTREIPCIITDSIVARRQIFP